MTSNNERWEVNYHSLRRYILENGHLPNKHKVECRALLNWWKYNQKRLKQGMLTAVQAQLLKELSKMRTKSE